jgi:[NiFe] hydrogenase diaphorase moiety large subunit
MLMTERERLVEELRALVDSFEGNRTALLPVLQTVQKKYRHVSDYAMQVLADLLRIHPVEVYSVVSFYSFLDHKPKGQFVIRLCRTISCDMQHKDRVARQLETDLGIRFGETTPDGKFSLEWAHCIGMCDQGPALLVNDGVHTHVTPERVHDILEGCRRTFGVHALNQAGRDGSRNGAPASTAANGNALTFAGIPADAGLTSALAKSRADIIADPGIRCAGGAGRAFRPASSGGRSWRPRPTASTSSATPTRASSGTSSDVICRVADLALEDDRRRISHMEEKGILICAGVHVSLCRACRRSWPAGWSGTCWDEISSA